MLTAIYHNFGIKVVDAKPVLKVLPKTFGHADKNVRAEAQNLTVELYRWLKEAMKPLFWGDLKPVQQQDLDKLFESVSQEPPPKQERFTRAQQDAMSAGGGDGDGAGGEADADGDDGGEVDAFDLAEPVDIMPSVPKDLHDNLSSSKWKDRKDALDALHNVANVPRIKDGPYDDIMRALAKCMKDANIAVVTVAAHTIEAFAKGLRQGFVKYRAVVMAPIMERLKEKKQSVADALGHALDAAFASTGLSDCLEDIMEFLKHKNPQVKQGTLKFLIRALRTTRDVPSKPETKSIAEAATKLLTESSEVVRSGGCEILGTLMKIMGERSMNPYMDGLDDIRKTKVKEFFETAEVRAKDRPKPIVGPPKTTAQPPAKRVVKKNPAGPKKPAAAPAAAQETPPSPAPSKPAAKGVGSRLGGLGKSSGLATPGSGLKMQRKLAGPGGAAPPQLQSPRRVVSPPMEDVPPTTPAPRFGLAASRGLAGRPIAKPSASSQEASAAVPPSAPAPSGISAIERAELDELRLEKERLTRTTEELRSERSKLTSEINELQNQNAQLIEDHTRDVLSIKAKETQLVRARSDAESAEQNVQKQQREIERLKRELSRAMRAGASSPTATAVPDYGLNMGVSENAGIYQDDGNHANRPASGLHMGSRFESARPRSFASASPSEEKENNGLTSPGLTAGYPGRRKLSPPIGSSYSSNRGSPARSTSRTYEGADSITTQMEPAENWKRAAEVTSQLKARIEQMKVSLVSDFHMVGWFFRC